MARHPSNHEQTTGYVHGTLKLMMRARSSLVSPSSALGTFNRLKACAVAVAPAESAASRCAEKFMSLIVSQGRIVAVHRYESCESPVAACVADGDTSASPPPNT